MSRNKQRTSSEIRINRTKRSRSSDKRDQNEIRMKFGIYDKKPRIKKQESESNKK